VTKPTKRKRTRGMNHTKTPINIIKHYFEKGMMNTSYETAADREYVAQLTGLTMKQVSVRQSLAVFGLNLLDKRLTLG
jgi:hypothetical protein